MSQAKKLVGIIGTLSLLGVLNVAVMSQNDSTSASLNVQSGSQTIYAGDGVIDGDICSQSDIVTGSLIEGITCDTTQNSISLPDIFIRPNRQNPTTTLNDVIVDDLRGFASSNYTITAEISDFQDAVNSVSINLGTNPDSITGSDVGIISSIEVTDSGSGYSNNVDVTISAPAAGTQATAVPVISGGQITSINVTNGGSGYTTGDTVTVTITDNGGTPTANAAAQARVIAENDNLSSGVLDSVTVTGGGTNYSNDITITIDAPASGTQATAEAAVVGGVITEIIVTNPGEGYDNTDTVNVTIVDNGGAGSGATATPNLTLEGDPQDNIFVTLDPSIGALKGLQPAGYSVADFAAGPRVLATSTTTQYTLFSTTQETATGRFGMDGIEFGLRVPAYVSAGTYEATITQTVIN